MSNRELRALGILREGRFNPLVRTVLSPEEQRIRVDADIERIRRVFVNNFDYLYEDMAALDTISTELQALVRLGDSDIRRRGIIERGIRGTILRLYKLYPSLIAWHDLPESVLHLIPPRGRHRDDRMRTVSELTHMALHGDLKEGDLQHVKSVLVIDNTGRQRTIPVCKGDGPASAAPTDREAVQIQLAAATRIETISNSSSSTDSVATSTVSSTTPNQQ